MIELDLEAGDGRTLHVYDTGPDGPIADGSGRAEDSADGSGRAEDSADGWGRAEDSAGGSGGSGRGLRAGHAGAGGAGAHDDGDGGTGERLVVFWHHGTPNIGAPPEPLFPAAARLRLRWVSYDRPGYGGSTPRPGRDVASAAADVAAIADALGIGRFAVMGHSGGAPHALACAALLPGRVVGAIAVSGMAPYGAEGLDWFAGMAGSGVESLRAAAAGRAEKERFEASGAEYDPEFTPADLAALSGGWSWVLSVVNPAVAAGPGGLIDDDLAYVAPWGFDPAEITAPVLLLHGGRDRVVPGAHAEWLAAHCPTAQLRLSPDDGHVSILERTPAALEWLRGPAVLSGG